jgi:hypothetical protein
MTKRELDDIKRLLAKFEQEYAIPLSMPEPSVYETAIVRLNEEILDQAQRDGVVSRESQCERDQTEARWQMAMTYAPFVNAIPSLLSDLDEAKNVITNLTAASQSNRENYFRQQDRADKLQTDLEAAEKHKQVLREALQVISQRHPGYGGSGEIARAALAETDAK